MSALKVRSDGADHATLRATPAALRSARESPPRRLRRHRQASDQVVARHDWRESTPERTHPGRTRSPIPDRRVRERGRLPGCHGEVRALQAGEEGVEVPATVAAIGLELIHGSAQRLGAGDQVPLGGVVLGDAIQIDPAPSHYPLRMPPAPVSGLRRSRGRTAPAATRRDHCRDRPCASWMFQTPS